jgi:hypothetical protein
MLLSVAAAAAHTNVLCLILLLVSVAYLTAEAHVLVERSCAPSQSMLSATQMSCTHTVCHTRCLPACLHMCASMYACRTVSPCSIPL